MTAERHLAQATYALRRVLAAYDRNSFTLLEQAIEEARDIYDYMTHDMSPGRKPSVVPLRVRG